MISFSIKYINIDNSTDRTPLIFGLAWQLSPASRQFVLAATPALWPAGHSLHAAIHHFRIIFLEELTAGRLG